MPRPSINPKIQNTMAVFEPAAMIETVSGALTKPKKQDGHKHGNYVLATHRKAASTNPNCQRIYLNKKTRYDRSTPISNHERAIRLRFKTVAEMVNERKNDLSKVSQDQAAFMAQKNLANGKKTMKAYLWYVCGQEYDQTNG